MSEERPLTISVDHRVYGTTQDVENELNSAAQQAMASGLRANERAHTRTCEDVLQRSVNEGSAMRIDHTQEFRVDVEYFRRNGHVGPRRDEYDREVAPAPARVVTAHPRHGCLVVVMASHRPTSTRSTLSGGIRE